MIIRNSFSCDNKSLSRFFLKQSLEINNAPAIHLRAEEVDVISLVEINERKNIEIGTTELGCKQNNSLCTLAISLELSR